MTDNGVEMEEILKKLEVKNEPMTAEEIQHLKEQIAKTKRQTEEDSRLDQSILKIEFNM